MTYYIEPTQDREGNAMFRASVYDDDIGITIAEDDFYNLSDAENWIAQNYPNATKG